MHTKFADETKFCEGREALQKDLSELEGWMISSHTKFKKCKCQTLHLWRGNPSYLYRLTDEKLESSPKERNVGVLVSDNLNQSSNVLCSPKNQSCSEVHQAQGCQPGEGRDCPALLCAAAALDALVWEPQCQQDIKVLESVQTELCRWWRVRRQGYEDQLRSLVCSALRRQRGRLMAACRGAKG